MAIKKGVVFILMLAVSSFIFGQVTADFTVNNTEGCASTGLQVIFTNTSTGATSYTWELDNGNPPSNFVDVVATYTAAGIYIVTLTATDGTDTDTQNIQITIHENPVAGFSVPGDTIGCPGLSVDFIDQSQSLDGNIISWTWDDGSSIIGVTQNPTHVFNTLGAYDIKLFVEDEFGCTDQITIVNQVVIIPPPSIGLSGTPILACSPPLDVTFSNTSSPGLIYNWDYGVSAATTSSMLDTVVSYNAVGTYDIALTVTDPIGCAVDTVILGYVEIEDVLANFQMTQDTGCPNVNTQFSTVGTSGADIYAWDYDDGGAIVIGGATGSHNYSLPGNYNVNLSVTSASGFCSHDTTVLIVIENFTAGIASSTTYGCGLPFSVSFTDVSIANAASWQWDFGDGSIDNLQNPVHNYNSEGMFLVSLEATSNNGCIESVLFEDTIVVNLPNADFSIVYNPNEVCFPSVVTLTDNSVADSLGTLTQWQWDFGNDSAIVTNVTPSAVTMTYDSAGEFTAVLTVTSSPNGCIDTLNLVVEIGKKLNPTDTVNPDTSCAINLVIFDGYAAEDSLADNWEWFGTGGLNGNGQSYSHQYNDTSAIGWNTDTLVVEYNGCYDTTFIDSVFIIGPIVEDIVVSAPNVCDSPYVRTFTATWIDTTTYVWRFGDGDTIISYGLLGAIPGGTNGGRTTGTFNNPRHEYQTSGDYTVTLEAWNQNAYPFDDDSCAYISDVQVQIRDVKADFSYIAVACASEDVAFSAAAANDAASFIWSFDNGNTGLGVADTAVYPASGFYDVTLTALDIYGCAHDTVKTIQVVAPAAAFIADTTEICFGGTINFTDQSVSDTAFMLWDWKFGDGGISINQNPSYTYISSGNFVVELLATDSAGCEATAQMNVLVIGPNAIFMADSLELCSDENTQFTDLSLPFNGATPILSWAWDFGDLNSSAAQHPNHSYALGGAYDIILTVTDSRGCTSTDTNIAYIDVQNVPIPAFFADNIKVCYDDATPVVFADTTATGDIEYWYWDINENGTYTADGTDSTIVFQYTERDTIDISLIVVTGYGCTDTLTKQDYIIAVGPVATFMFTPDTICNGDTVEFTVLTTQNVTGYSWDFGDGGVSPDSIAQHAYNTTQSQYITPALHIESVESFGICEFNEKQDSIYVHHIDIGYATNPTFGCAPLDVTFLNSSTGSNLEYSWDFDEGEGLNPSVSPTNVYETAGIYNVSLTIIEMMTNDNIPLGCIDTMSTQIVVYPDPAIQINEDVKICLGDNAWLSVSATDAVTYEWSNGYVGAPLVTAPIDDQTFSVTVTDVNGCKDSESVNVGVVNVSAISISTDSLVEAGNPSGTSTLICNDINIWINDTNDVPIDESAYNLVWTPSDGLSCSTCSETNFDAQVTTLYSISVTDVEEVCPTQVASIEVTVLDVFAFDLPDFFSPNGDEENEVVHVKGYGVKELQVFEIYNRWGEKVFENTETDLSVIQCKDCIGEGWDGTFKGKPQNMDTYVGVAVVKNCHDEVFTIKKHITLYR